MKSRPSKPLPVALLAVPDPAAHDFLRVHLEDRGFAVAAARDAAELGRLKAACELVVADFDLWAASCRQAGGAARLGDLLLVSARPTIEDAVAAAKAQALDYLGVPFADPRALATLLDGAARRARNRVAERLRAAEGEPALTA